MSRARVYAIALGVLSIAVLLLLGCERNSVSEETLVERPKATPTADIEGVVVREPGDMLSLSISYSAMSRISAYNYTLKENDGEVLFSCFFFNDDYEEVSFEDMPVDSKYMDELRSLVEQHGFADMDYKKPGLLELAADAPTYSLTMRFPQTIGGRVYSDAHRLNYHPAGTEDLMKIFLELREIFVSGART